MGPLTNRPVVSEPWRTSSSSVANAKDVCDKET